MTSQSTCSNERSRSTGSALISVIGFLAALPLILLIMLELLLALVIGTPIWLLVQIGRRWQDGNA